MERSQSEIKLRDDVRRYSARVYFCLAFAISWGGSLLIGGPGFVRGEIIAPNDLWAMGAAVFVGPLLTGLAMSYVGDGRSGLRDLYARMTRWHIGGRWYLALLVFPVLLLVVSAALSVWVTPELAPTFFAPGILMGLLAGFIEEIGWLGFAYPKMRDKLDIVRVSLILGSLHALWHVLPDFMGRYQAFGVLWLPTIVGFCAHVVALRILIVWVYENTESLLLVQLMHASTTGVFRRAHTD